MSRHTLQDNKSAARAVVGYDNGLQTFYARIYKTVENGGSAVPDEPVLWVGTTPHEIATARELAERIKSEFTLADADIEKLEDDQRREQRPPSALQRQMFNMIGGWKGNVS